MIVPDKRSFCKRRRNTMAHRIAKKYGPWAVITGASAGIGAEFARSLASKGVNVVLVARGQERLQTIESELTSKYGIDTRVVPLDLTRTDAAEALTQVTADLDVGLVINNAGVATPAKFAESSLLDVMQEVDTNYRAPIAITHAFLPRLKERKRAGIIVVSSTIGYGPAPYLSVYGSLKAALRQFGRTLRHELSSTGVDVLVVSPGATKTDMAAAMMGDKLWMAGSPTKVVTAGLRALGRKGEIVPGVMNKIMTFMTGRLITQTFAARMNGKFVELMLPAAQAKPASQNAA
jgi:uncharacterized protein